MVTYFKVELNFPLDIVLNLMLKHTLVLILYI